MNKKGVELTLSTIVIAVIVLIVLIVMVYLITGKLGEGGRKLEEAKSPYSLEKCEIPGTTRTCRHSYVCEEKGGDIIKNAECDFGVCCSI